MGSIDQNNSYVFPLNSGEFFEGLYSSTTNFSEILISVETNSTFQLDVIFSSNSVDEGFIKTFEETSVSESALIYSIRPYLRYFYVKLTNTGESNQTYLRLETILKSTVVYEPDQGAGPATNVNIKSPLNGGGYVQMVDMNNHYDVDGNLLVSTVISDPISTIITSPLVDGNIAVNLQAINSDYLTGNNLNVSVTNAILPVSNDVLDNMTFVDNQLIVNDTEANTTLTNIYNSVNTRGGLLLYDDSIEADTNTPSIDLSNIPIKLVTVYGQSSSDTTLTLVFSNQNENFWKSQYSISVVANQNFGFSVACCPKYLSINSSNSVPYKLSVYVDYS